MASLRLMSWNVRGMGSPRKRLSIFMHIRKYNPHLICLQETHLVPDRISQLRKPWVQWSLHSTYSTYSRGVSLLVHRSLRWEVGLVQKDPEGRYVFVHAWIDSLPYVLLGLYLPPPANLSVLHQAARFAAQFPSATLLCFGDFNLVFDPTFDRFSASPGPSTTSPPTALAQFLGEMGWHDLWRLNSPSTLVYSCHSTGSNALSRIDYLCGNARACTEVVDIQYLPRAVSDHSPILAEFAATVSRESRTSLRINPFWLNLFLPNDRIPDQLAAFLEVNLPPNNPALTWETFKAYLRGCLKSSISYVKKESARVEEALSHECLNLEAAYIANPSDEARNEWLRTGRQYLLCIQEKARRSQFFNKQKFYELGNQSSHLLAHIIHQNTVSPAILRIAATTGEILTSSNMIRDRLLDFYSGLYQSTTTGSHRDLCDYLGSLTFPQLTEDQRVSLDGPITLPEVVDALESMARGKSPGPDGIPTEVYMQYQDHVLPLLLDTYHNAHRLGTLPESFYDASIVVLLKPDKHPEDCGSYRPISLLNVDYKILAKILASRLGRVILDLVHLDQTGFMPGKSTSDNIRRAQVVAQIGSKGRENWALASLDAAKAFDSVEWDYLFQVLREFGFGEGFVKWISILYKSPRAAVLVNGGLSSPFRLHRGTRQGCPISPLLFALAIEPLAIALRSDSAYTGIKIGSREDRVALYADDMLLFLSNPRLALPRAIDLIDTFGSFSGLCINWSKSSLMPLSPVCDLGPDDHFCRLPISPHFKYLGVYIANDYRNSVPMNITPLLDHIKTKFKVWSSLPLSIAGRINLIKMVVLPKCLYALQHSPVLVPRKFFHSIESLMSNFIWGRSRAKLRVASLQRPKDLAGVALPDLFLYYIAGQFRIIRSWFLDGMLPNSEAHLAYVLHIDNFWPLLEYPQLFAKNMLPVHRLACQVWKQAKTVLGFTDIMADLSLWSNPGLPEFHAFQDYQWWRDQGVQTLGDVVLNNVFMSFDQLQSRFQIPRQSFFRYLQLRHVFSNQFPSPRENISKFPLIGVLRSQGPKGLISALYTHLITSKISLAPNPALERWKELIPGLTDDTFQELMASSLSVSPAANNKLTQVYITHQCYLTPVRLYRMGRISSPACIRCTASRSDFWHMIWECPVIRDFWGRIVELLSEVLTVAVPFTPEVCLFGILDDEQWPHYTRIFLKETLFLARKAIALRWMGDRVPSLSQWRNMVNSVIPLNSLVYKHRGCPAKFGKVWGSWCDSPVTLYSAQSLSNALSVACRG